MQNKTIFSSAKIPHPCPPPPEMFSRWGNLVTHSKSRPPTDESLGFGVGKDTSERGTASESSICDSQGWASEGRFGAKPFPLSLVVFLRVTCWTNNNYLSLSLSLSLSHSLPLSLSLALLMLLTPTVHKNAFSALHTHNFLLSHTSLALAALKGQWPRSCFTLCFCLFPSPKNQSFTGFSIFKPRCALFLSISLNLCPLSQTLSLSLLVRPSLEGHVEKEGGGGASVSTKFSLPPLSVRSSSARPPRKQRKKGSDLVFVLTHPREVDRGRASGLEGKEGFYSLDWTFVSSWLTHKNGLVRTTSCNQLGSIL